MELRKRWAGKLPLTVWLGLIFWCVLFWVYCLRAEIIDRVVAVVNDEVITLSELDEACLPFFQEYLRGVTDPLEEERIVRKIRKEVLERLIEEKLIEEEVRKYKIEVTDQEVEAFIKDVTAQLGGEERLRAFLANQGLNMSAYREKVRERIRKLKLVQGSIRARIVITQEDLRRYYQKHYLSEKNQTYVLAAIITSSENKIKEAVQELAEGKDFVEVARRYSEVPGSGEGLGSFQGDELSPEVRKVVSRMKPGEVSPPIKVGKKWQIFKILKIEKKPAIPFEKVKEEIYETLFQKELDTTFKKWIKELKERAFIKVFI